MRRLAVLGAVLALAACQKHETKAPPEVTPPPPKLKPWIVVSKNDDSWLLINSKIDTAKEYKRVWYGVANLDAKDDVATSTSLTEFDCANRAERELQELGYDSKSKPVKFEVHEKLQWTYPPPDTVGYGVMEFACEGKRMKDKGGFEKLEEARAAMLSGETN